MEPINYILDVQSPIQQAMKGYGLARQDIEQNQIMAEREQLMGMRDTAEARAASEFEMRRAEAERQRAEAERGQAAFMRLAELGNNATSDDFLQAWVANPAMRQDISSLKTMLEGPKLDTMLKTSQDLYAAARLGNVDAVRNQVTLQLEAAKNSGDEGMAATYGSALDLLNTNPEAAMQSIGTINGLTILGIKGPEYLGQVDKQLGVGQVEQTEAVRTLEQRAELAGLVRGTPEYNQFMVSGGKPPEGMVFRSLPGGGFELVQGSGAGAGQGAKPTEGQLAATAYLQRMVGSEADLSELEAEGDVALPFGANLVVDTTFEGLLSLSEGQQRLLQAQRDWVRAKLRKESGAEIPPAEMMAEMRTYFPQPGDGQKTIAQKRAARARAMTQMEIMSGAEPGAEEVPPAAELPEAFINNPTVQRLVQENASVGVTAESIWNAMTAEERAAYGG
jgi:hypothetical protein